MAGSSASTSATAPARSARSSRTTATAAAGSAASSCARWSATTSAATSPPNRCFPPGGGAGRRRPRLGARRGRPARGLGPALAWARRQGASGLHLLADRDTGLLARRAAAFSVSDHGVARRRARAPAGGGRAAGAGRRPRPPSISRSSRRSRPAAHLRSSNTASSPARSAGSRCAASSTTPHGGQVRLEVGVGVHDREAFALIHGDVPTVDALAGVVEAVTRHRGGEASDHPLDRLAPERLLRWRLEQDPTAIGLDSLAPAEPPVPRPSIKDRAPCTALGRRATARPWSWSARSASTST